MKFLIKTRKWQIIYVSLFLLSLLAGCGSKAPGSAGQPQLTPPDRVDLVYFYDSKICLCQLAPGEHIQSILFIDFNGEMASGKLTYKMVDLATDNSTLPAKYGTNSQSLYATIVRGDQEKTIAVPELLVVKFDEEATDRLIKNRVTLYLSGAL